MSLCFDDLTDAPWTDGVVSSQGELVPRTTLQGLQSVRALAGADGKFPPLLAVVH